METKDHRWVVKWVSVNRMDGRSEHFIRGNDHNILLFPTRAAARAFTQKTYGYIATRRDLKQEPHGWRTPQVVKAEVTVCDQKAAI